MPAQTSNVSGIHQGSQGQKGYKWFSVLAASALTLAGCGGGGGSTVPPPLVNVCEQILSPEAFASIGLSRPGDRRNDVLGPGSLEFYFDAAGNFQTVLENPPPPGTLTFYSDLFLYFPSAANVTGVTLRLTSPVFDPLLIIGGFDGNRNLDRSLVFVNDDAAPGNFTTSELTIPVRQDRCYLLQVQSYWAQNAPPDAGPGSPGRGPYTIEVVGEIFAAPPPPPQRQQKPEDREAGGGGDRGGGVGI